MQDRALIRRRAAATAAGEGRRGPALGVGGLEELAHEADAGLTDVGAAGEHVEDGVDGAAEVSEGRDVWTGCLGGRDHRFAVLQQTDHLEGEDRENDDRGRKETANKGPLTMKALSKRKESVMCNTTYFLSNVVCNLIISCW